MSESNVEEAPAPEPHVAGTATEPPHTIVEEASAPAPQFAGTSTEAPLTGAQGRLEQVMSSVRHAVEKVTGALHSHKGDNAHKP